MSKTLEAIRRDRRVEDAVDEREIGNSIIVTLARGYRRAFGDVGEHVVGHDTFRGMWWEIRNAKPCDCDECKASAQ